MIIVSEFNEELIYVVHFSARQEPVDLYSVVQEAADKFAFEEGGPLFKGRLSTNLSWIGSGVANVYKLEVKCDTEDKKIMLQLMYKKFAQKYLKPALKEKK